VSELFLGVPVVRGLVSELSRLLPVGRGQPVSKLSICSFVGRGLVSDLYILLSCQSRAGFRMCIILFVGRRPVSELSILSFVGGGPVSELTIWFLVGRRPVSELSISMICR